MADFARRALDLKTPEGDKKAFEMFSKMVECGYKLCLPELGIMYFAGRGTKRDYKKAIETFQRGVSDGDLGGIVNCVWLALMYKKALGTEKSEEMSSRYVGIAERFPNYEMVFTYLAKHLLGLNGSLYNFELAPKCPELGVELLERAVSSKVPYMRSFVVYANLMEEGKYVKQDLKRAAEYYERFGREYAKHNYAEFNDLRGFSSAIKILKNSPDKKDQEKAFKLA